MPTFIPRLGRSLAIALVVIGTLGSEPTKTQALQTIGGFELVSEVRVTRTVSQYTYRATLTNLGGALGGATATVTSSSARTVIVDNAVSFGAIGPGASQISTDTFSFRHDRTVPFSWANLRWQIATVTYVPAEGVLLLGAGAANAVGALVRKDPLGANPEDVVDGVLLTRLDVVIRGDATVGQVNDALASVGGGIVTMRPALPVVTVGVPRQTDESALQSLANRLVAMAGVRFAMVGRTLEKDIAPDAPANTFEHMYHLLEARLPAAWNVNALAECESKVTVLVADLFFRPALAGYNDFASEVPGVTELGTGTDANPSNHDHGRDVLTTLAAAFNAAMPTGANPFPQCLDIRALQVANMTPLEATLAIENHLPASGPTVVNLSFGYAEECDAECRLTGQGLQLTHPVTRAIHGIVARRLFRQYEDRTIITPAAGNQAVDFITALYPGANDARFSNPLSIAASSDAAMSWVAEGELWRSDITCTNLNPPVCLGPLTATADQRAVLDGLLSDLGELDAAPLANVLITGSTNGTAPSSFSECNATVMAVGEGIPTIDGRFTNGTSFAAPQVAGLASYLLMVSPGGGREVDSTARVVSAITGNLKTMPAGHCLSQTETVQHSDMIDAYDSVLSFDPPGAPDAATWDMRRTILDVTGDRQFTEADLSLMVQQFFVAPDFQNEVSPASREDSRYDLNGDGYTGGRDKTWPFDLDRTGSTQFGATLLTELEFYVGGAPRHLDEHAVTDLDIVCYYAHSPLYQGTEADREQILANRCAPITVAIDPSAATVAPDGTVQFSADVDGTTDPHVTWSLPDGGGSVSDTGLFTAGSTEGSFRVRATSVVDAERFAEATVTIEEDAEPPVPPGTYAGTIRQQYVVTQDGRLVVDFEVRWRVRLLSVRGPSHPPDDVSGTAEYRRVSYEYYQESPESPVCLLTTTTREGDLSVRSYSGRYTGSNPEFFGRGGYFTAAGNVDNTIVRSDCLGNPGTNGPTSFPEGASTAQGLGNLLFNTLPIQVLDNNGTITALIWNFTHSDGTRTDSVIGRVDLYP